MTRRLVLVSSCLLAACASKPCPPPSTAACVSEAPAPEVVASSEGEPAQPAAPEKTTESPTLLIDGPPEVPTPLRARLRQYLETRQADLYALSQDGKTMLVRTRFGNTAQMHLVSTPLGARKQLTFEDEPIADAEFVPGENALWFMKDTGGNEDYQIYRLNLNTGSAELLTDGKSRHQGLTVQRGGGRIAYANNARNGRDMDIYVADGKTRASEQRVLEAQGNFTPITFSRDGKRLLVREYLSIAHSELHVVDLEAKTARRITSGPPAAHRSAFFSADGKRVYVASDREGEMTELYEGDLDQEPITWTPLTRNIAWNVELASLSPDGRTIAFVTNEEGYGVLRLLDTRTRKHRVAKNLPRAIIASMRYAEKADVIGLTLARPTSSNDVYAYDPRRETLVRYTESEMGGLDPASFIEPELVRVTSFDGLSVPAFVYRPRGEGPYPVVIDIHGGPESQARPRFHPLAQYLAKESGIATVVPNVRGSDGYGKSYLALDNGKNREHAVKDIGAILDWIERDPALDGKRVAVMGGSYGGYMVLASLVHYGTRLKGGIDMVGIANFVTFLENTRDYRRDLRRAEYGDESNPDMRAFLQDISPLTHVDRINAALLVGHGVNDPRVPVSEAEQIVKAVRARGREVWQVLATNEGHGFHKKENRDRFSEISVMFLERILAPSHTP